MKIHSLNFGTQQPYIINYSFNSTSVIGDIKSDLEFIIWWNIARNIKYLIKIEMPKEVL